MSYDRDSVIFGPCGELQIAVAQWAVGCDTRHREKTQEADMTRVIAVISLGLLLTVTTLAWNPWASRPARVSADTFSNPISDIMIQANAQSLPVQEIEDRAMAFISADTQ